MWEQIRSNQRRSVILVACIGAAWLLIGLVLGLFAGSISPLGLLKGGTYGIIFASIFSVFIPLVAYFYGDIIILAMSGARKIRASDLRRIYNIVEEMAIASGLEIMPSAYVIDDSSMNAFAVGCRKSKSAIIVTSGLLNQLNRDELQGVIGHEIAHIKNRDVLLMSMCITLLGIMDIVTWLWSYKRFSKSNILELLIDEENRDLAGEAFAFFLLIFSPVIILASIVFIIVLGIGSPFIILLIYIPTAMLLTPLLGKLIYFAISRRREYLADACSALYTRYPEGLASALEKIAASIGQVLAASLTTAPIYIVNPFREQGMVASDITSTHPPISERICILRAMSYASYADYDRAYREIRNIDTGIIPHARVTAAGIVPMREAMPEDLDHIQRARETSNVLWNMNNYKIINCPCGTRMRLPPKFKYLEVKCPHCGKVSKV